MQWSCLNKYQAKAALFCYVSRNMQELWSLSMKQEKMVHYCIDTSTLSNNSSKSESVPKVCPFSSELRTSKKCSFGPSCEKLTKCCVAAESCQSDVEFVKISKTINTKQRRLVAKLKRCQRKIEVVHDSDNLREKMSVEQRKFRMELLLLEQLIRSIRHRNTAAPKKIFSPPQTKDKKQRVVKIAGTSTTVFSKEVRRIRKTKEMEKKELISTRRLIDLLKKEQKEKNFTSRPQRINMRTINEKRTTAVPNFSSSNKFESTSNVPTSTHMPLIILNRTAGQFRHVSETKMATNIIYLKPQQERPRNGYWNETSMRTMYLNENRSSINRGFDPLVDYRKEEDLAAASLEGLEHQKTVLLESKKQIVHRTSGTTKLIKTASPQKVSSLLKSSKFDVKSGNPLKIRKILSRRTVTHPIIRIDSEARKKIRVRHRKHESTRNTTSTTERMMRLGRRFRLSKDVHNTSSIHRLFQDNKNSTACSLYYSCITDLYHSEVQCEKKERFGRLMPGLPGRRHSKCNHQLIPRFQELDQKQQMEHSMFIECVGRVAKHQISKDKIPSSPSFQPNMEDCSMKQTIMKRQCDKLQLLCPIANSCRQRVNASQLTKETRELKKTVSAALKNCQIQSYEAYLLKRQKSRKLVSNTSAVVRTVQ